MKLCSFRFQLLLLSQVMDKYVTTVLPLSATLRYSVREWGTNAFSQSVSLHDVYFNKDRL